MAGEITWTPEQQQAVVEARNALERERQAAIAEAQAQMESEQIAKEGALREAKSGLAGEQDSGAMQALKYTGAGLRGTGEGIAETLDMVHQPWQWLYEVGKNAALESTGTPYTRKPVTSPLADAYNAVMPAPPSGYETTNDVASVVGPAVIETAATLGLGGPEAAAGAGVRYAGKQLLRNAPKIAAKSAYNVGTGVVGGEAGGAAGDVIGDIFGDAATGREVGTAIGSLFGKPITHAGARFAGDVVSGKSKPSVFSSGPAIAAYDMFMEGGPSMRNLAMLATPAIPAVVNAVKSPVATAQAAKAAIMRSKPTLGDLLAGSTRAAGSEIFQDNPYLPHFRKGEN